MFRLFVLTLLMIFSMDSMSYAVDGISAHVPQADIVGEGRLRLWGFNVYDATLYAPKGQWDESKPYALKITYLRSISSEKIIDRSLEEMESYGDFTTEVIKRWREQMAKIIPDVDKGYVLNGIRTKDGHTIFYNDERELGRIEDDQFTNAFFNIWLNEKTTAPDLRRKLLAQN